MFLSVNRIPHPIPSSDRPDPKAAQALQEGLGGQFGEMRTMMQYFFQNMNFRGDAKTYQHLLRSVATEEMGHVEQITNTINLLLQGASTNTNKPNELPLSIALESPNIQHFLVAGQSARLADAAGNPWSASYVYDSGNLVLNLLYNLMLEATGRLQKCRLYEMSDNRAFRSTVSYLIVRDLVHEKVFAKALQTLGINWGKALPVPRFDSEGMPEVKDLERKNLHNQMWTFTNKGEVSLLYKIFKGESPFDDGGRLEVIEGFPDGVNIPDLPDAPQEFAPGLDEELKRLSQQLLQQQQQQTLSYKDSTIGTSSFSSRLDASSQTSSRIFDSGTSSSSSSSYSNINWNDIIKKESRGLGDINLGEVQEINGDYIVTQRGVLNKETFYLPKNLVLRFDGHDLWFNIIEDEADNYKRD